MGRKKKNDNDSNESLSEFQDTSKTGRTEGVEITREENGTTTISGTAEAIVNTLEKVAEKAKRKSIVITAAELVDQMFCNYKYEHAVGPNTINKVSTKSEVPVHSDMVIAFRKLDPHFALICEEVDKNLIGDINDIDHESTADKIRQFTVTHLILDGSEEARSVVLKGTKTLSTGEDIKLETPKISLDDDYPFATEFTSTIQDCVHEVEEFMKGNKQAESPQQELPFGSESEEEKYAEEEL